MTITVQQFRADFPEFGSTTEFTNNQIQFWLNLAYNNFLNPDRWGQTIDIGAELFTAHNIVLDAKAVAEASNGGIPGEQVGPVSSKTVDKVSVSYDTNAGLEMNAGHWNMSVYGTRFIRLARMMGSGPLLIGVGAVPPLSGAGWPGPSVVPGFTNFG